MRDVIFLLLPGTLLLDLAGPAEAFRLANQRLQRQGQAAAFRLRYVAPGVEAATSVGVRLGGLEKLPPQLADGSWVVLLGQPSGQESPLRRPLGRAWSEARRWLAAVVAPGLEAAPGATAPPLRLLTVCAGALLAADAGLIGQRQCTTHHENLADLQRLAPQARVLPNRVFVIDGALASSAGISAGIDLALHLVAENCGERVAVAVAQSMVVYLRRGADDPQASPLLHHRNHLHPAVHRAQDAVADAPAEAWPLARLAAAAHVAPRHLARLFVQHAGCTPHAFVQGVRKARADEALRAGIALPAALVAAGIGSERQWRRLKARY